MCDIQGKLIGWIDRELPADQAGEVERHVERCEECRRWVATYGQVGEAFDAYCDAVMVAKAPRRVPRWMPVLVGAVVAASVMLLAFLRTRVEPPSIVAPTVASASVPNPCSGARHGSAGDGHGDRNCDPGRSDVSARRRAEWNQFHRRA
jgi:anti-sigma factor RsiW